MNIGDMRNYLGIRLSEEVIEDLMAFSEIQKETGFDMRLMTVEEIIEVNNYFKTMRLFKEIVPLLTDDNSNYAAIYIDGPLRGKICFLDHEETDLSPTYRTIQSFTERLKVNPESDWYSLPRDYPSLDKSADLEMIDEDWSIVENLRYRIENEQAIDEEYKAYIEFCIMALTPFDKLDTITPYLFSNDMWVQERACYILGLFGYEKASGDLKIISEKGMHNGKVAAKRALAKIRQKRLQNKEKLETDAKSHSPD